MMNDGEEEPDALRMAIVRLLRFLAALAGLSGISIIIVIGVLALGQSHFMYPAPGGGARPPLDGWRRFAIEGPDGPQFAYHRPARAGMPTVLFLHGNGTGYDDSVVATSGMTKTGFGVLVPEYPGYGGNPGSPSEETLAGTADRAYDWLASHGVPAQRIVIYGNSVGTGPAVHVAQRPHAALILVSGVASMVDVVRHHYPIAPAMLVRDRYENADALASIRPAPTLIVHARDDRVVPYDNGMRLARSAHVPLMSMDHGDHFLAFDPDISERIAQWTLQNIH